MPYYVHQSIPYLSDEEIENRAARLLDAYQVEAGPLLVPPVPVELIAEGLLNLRMDWDAIDNPQVLARLDPQSQTVTFNLSRRDFFEDYFGSQNFTIGHEVGHWDLHIYFSEAVQLDFFNAGVQSFLCRSDERDRREIQANKFAACLLMPRSLVVREYYCLDVVSWSSLYRLASRFEVSKEAIKNRLLALGLITIEGREILPSKVGQGNLWEKDRR